MNVIVEVDENWGIGKDNDQQVYIPQDLQRFKELTMGKPILLGRKTMATFPGGKPLKNRRNIILSTREGYAVEGAQVVKTVEEALAAATADTFVVGGASVYEQMLPYCTRAYVTKVHAALPADCHFPNLDADPHWRVTEEEGPYQEGEITFTFVTYERR